MAQAAPGGVVVRRDLGVADADEELVQVLADAPAQHRLAAGGFVGLLMGAAQRAQFGGEGRLGPPPGGSVRAGEGPGAPIEGVDPFRLRLQRGVRRVAEAPLVEVAQQVRLAALLDAGVVVVDGGAVAGQHALRVAQHLVDDLLLAALASAPTIAPTLSVGARKVWRYHWIARSGSRASSRKVAIRLTGWTPSRWRPSTTPAVAAGGTTRRRQAGQWRPR